MRAEFDVKMSQKVMFDFLLSHRYGSISGWIGVVIGVIVLAMVVVTWGDVPIASSMLYLFFAVYFLPLQPLLLYFRAVRQVKLNPMYKEPLHYVIDESGITTSQKEAEAHIDWDQVVMIKKTSYSLLLYTGKRYSFVLPKECMKGQEQTVEKLIEQYYGKSAQQESAAETEDKNAKQESAAETENKNAQQESVPETKNKNAQQKSAAEIQNKNE